LGDAPDFALDFVCFKLLITNRLGENLLVVAMDRRYAAGQAVGSAGGIVTEIQNSVGS
jgi:hypothetical protein